MPPRRRIPRPLLAFAVLCLAALAAEGGYRAWHLVRWGAYSRARTLERFEGMRDAVLGVRPGEGRFEERRADYENAPPWSVHPYLGFDFERTPTQIGQELAQQGEADDAFDILLVGGSVAGDFGYLGRPALFEALAADARLAGRELRLFNHARPTHKQPQQLLAVEYLLALGLRPDAVISLDGFNEVAIGAENAQRGVHPGHPADSQWLPLISAATRDSRTFEIATEVFVRRDELLRAIDSASDSVLLTSALAARPLLAGVKHRQARYAAAVERLSEHLGAGSAERARRGPDFPRDEQQVLELCVRVWSESTRSLAAVCARRGIPCVVVLQPTLHDLGSKPLSAREVEQGGAREAWERGARLGYPLLREAGEALRTEGVRFVDASGVFREHEDELYVDACHFNEAGHSRLAREVAAGLLAGL